VALAPTDQILQSTHQWLKPLIHVLLSCGITSREFAQLAHGDPDRTDVAATYVHNLTRTGTGETTRRSDASSAPP
jgi:hypothetical protein